MLFQYFFRLFDNVGIRYVHNASDQSDFIQLFLL